MLFKSKAENLHKPDAWLIDKFAKTKQLDYLGILYERYMHLVYGISLKYLQDRPASQDAVMQIFEKLIEEIPKREIANFKSWLYVLAKNHCLMYLRSQRARINQEKHIEEYNEIFMDSNYELHHNNEMKLEQDIQLLKKCIEELRSQQKECVKLFYLEEKCYQEIAEITNFEMKKVKSYIQNGRRNLKICMDKNV